MIGSTWNSFNTCAFNKNTIHLPLLSLGYCCCRTWLCTVLISYPWIGTSLAAVERKEEDLVVISLLWLLFDSELFIESDIDIIMNIPIHLHINGYCHVVRDKVLYTCRSHGLATATAAAVSEREKRKMNRVFIKRACFKKLTGWPGTSSIWK